MRTGLFRHLGRGVFMVFALFFGCRRGSDGISSAPPLTSPLSRSVIGYGVVTSAYINVVDEPNPRGGVSLGYLRMGSLVRILERRLINEEGTVESWVLAEGDYRGWLREGVLRIYDNEAQAQTAAKLLVK